MRLSRRRRRFGAAATVLALAACEGSDEDRLARGRDGPDPRAPRIGPAGPCGYRTAARLTGDGIGGLIVGRTVEELAADCLVVSDTVDPLGPEGMPQRLLRVELGPDTVTVEVVEDRVFRLDVRSPRIVTVDALGVGTMLGELLHVQDLRGVSGEGALFAVSPSHCGLSFALGPEPPERAGTSWTRGALAELPDTLSVRRVLAYGCAR
jgi:hypothetical protein